jgi:hypothetical protein
MTRGGRLDRRRKKISEDPATCAALNLVRHGVPFDVAFSLDWPELNGWNVALGRMTTGRSYDWAGDSWS